MSAWTCRLIDGKAAAEIVPLGDGSNVSISVGSFASIPRCPQGVRFTPKTGHSGSARDRSAIQSALGFLTLLIAKPDDQVKLPKETVRLPSVWSRRLLEIENIGDQVVGLSVRDYQIRHSPVIRAKKYFQ